MVNGQVLFSPLWTDGAAAGSGEDAELFFSFLSPAAATTRHMGETGANTLIHHLLLLLALLLAPGIPPLNDRPCGSLCDLTLVCIVFMLSGRDDRLTGASKAWAWRKRHAQPQLLHARQKKIQGKLDMARAALEKACMELLGTPSANSIATITSLIAQIIELARSNALSYSFFSPTCSLSSCHSH